MHLLVRRRENKVHYRNHKNNLRYCKELMSIVDELRHLDGVKGNFYVTEHEYVAPSTTLQYPLLYTN